MTHILGSGIEHALAALTIAAFCDEFKYIWKKKQDT